MTLGLFTSSDFSAISDVAISAIKAVLPFTVAIFGALVGVSMGLKVFARFGVSDDFDHSGHWTNKFLTTKANIHKPIYKSYIRAQKEQAEIYRAINS